MVQKLLTAITFALLLAGCDMPDIPEFEEKEADSQNYPTMLSEQELRERVPGPDEYAGALANH